MNLECAALAEDTDSQEARSHGDARRGRSIGRRAKHALTSRQAAFGGQSNGPQLFAVFVVVTFFVV